jgi:hypothetical protein
MTFALASFAGQQAAYNARGREGISVYFGA